MENLKLIFVPDQSNPRFRKLYYSNQNFCFFLWFWQQTFEPHWKLLKINVTHLIFHVSVLICVFITNWNSIFFCVYFCVSYNLNCFLYFCCCSYLFIFFVCLLAYSVKIANANELPTNTQQIIIIKNNNILKFFFVFFFVHFIFSWCCIFQLWNRIVN